MINTHKDNLGVFFFSILHRVLVCKLIFIRIWLLYNVLIASALHRSESVIHIHISPLFQVVFPFRSPQNIEQSSLCYTVGSCCSIIQSHLTLCDAMDCTYQASLSLVLINYLFYTWQYIFVNPNLPIHPISPSSYDIHKLILYICVSVSALQISSAYNLSLNA